MKRYIAVLLPLFIYNGMFLSENQKNVKENEIISETIMVTNSEILETTVKGVYYTSKDLFTELNDLGKKITGEDLEIQKEESKVFTINIEQNSVLIELKGVVLEDKSEVSVKLTALNNKRSLDYLEKYLHYYTKNKETEPKYYKYLKGKLNNNKVEVNNERVKTALKAIGFKAVDTIPITSGITGYASFRKNISKDKINLNYSICSYKTGTYIFIGTPIIDEIY